MKKFVMLCVGLMLLFYSGAQNREKAFEINAQMGRGINYGNMFEAPSENAWGNPWQPEYAAMIAELGFNHVRIPVRWEPLDRSDANYPYTINPAFFERIKRVVDSALNQGLYVILNMHHHETLFENPESQKARFLAQWQQIAAFFKDYSDSLVFELLNEPHGNLTAQKWNGFLQEALAKIRVDNPERIVLIGTAEYGGLGGLSKLQLPNDNNIIVTVHYYNPFQFTHQGASWAGEQANQWLGTKWNDTETERQVMRNDFAPLKTFEEKNNVPIHIGEFGAYSKADIESRAKWTTFIARYLESLGWSWAYWEFSAGFGIYDINKSSFNYPLVNALLHDSIPKPASYVGTTVYSSSFSSNIDDWTLNLQAGASASKNQVNNMLEIKITQAGTENWHVQLTKNNVQIKQGKKYRLTLRAKSGMARNLTSYIGQSSSPWQAYSGYHKLALTDTFNTYSYVFDASVTDNAARIVFDLGKSEQYVALEYIRLEEIVLQTPTSVKAPQKYKSKVYPNPVKNELIIENRDEYNKFAIVNINGKTLVTNELTPLLNKVNLEHLVSGIYFVKLMNEKNSDTLKLLKD